MNYYDPRSDASRFRSFADIYRARETKRDKEDAERTQNILTGVQAAAIPLKLLEDRRSNTLLEVELKKREKNPDTVSGLMYEEIPYEAPDRAKFDPRRLMDKFNERYRGVDERLRPAELKGVASTGNMEFEMPGAETAQQNLQSYATRLTGEAPPMSFGAQPQMFGGKGLSSATPLYEPLKKAPDFSGVKNVNTAPSATQALLDSSINEDIRRPDRMNMPFKDPGNAMSNITGRAFPEGARTEGGIRRTMGMDMPFKTQKEGFGQIEQAFPDSLKDIRRSSEGLGMPGSVKTPQDPGFRPLAAGTKADPISLPKQNITPMPITEKEAREKVGRLGDYLKGKYSPKVSGAEAALGTKANPIPLPGAEVTADAGSLAGEATKGTSIGGALGVAGTAKSLYDIAKSDATGGRKLKAAGETGLDYASSAAIGSGNPYLAGAGVAYKGGKALWDLLT